VLLKIVYLLTYRVLSLAVVVFCGDLAKDAELLVLRHENAVLRRHAGQVRYEPGDWAWLAALARLVPRRRWAEVFPVTPATHRRLAARGHSRVPDRGRAGQFTSSFDAVFTVEGVRILASPPLHSWRPHQRV
jgi:hypothetical protein